MVHKLRRTEACARLAQCLPERMRVPKEPNAHRLVPRGRLSRAPSPPPPSAPLPGQQKLGLRHPAPISVPGVRAGSRMMPVDSSLVPARPRRADPRPRLPSSQGGPLQGVLPRSRRRGKALARMGAEGTSRTSRTSIASRAIRKWWVGCSSTSASSRSPSCSASSRSGSTSSFRRPRSGTPPCTASTTSCRAPSASAKKFCWDTPIDEESWRHAHNVRHHGNTNVYGRDPDVYSGRCG